MRAKSFLVCELCFLWQGKNNAGAQRSWGAKGRPRDSLILHLHFSISSQRGKHIPDNVFLLSLEKMSSKYLLQLFRSSFFFFFSKQVEVDVHYFCGSFLLKTCLIQKHMWNCIFLLLYYYYYYYYYEIYCWHFIKKDTLMGKVYHQPRCTFIASKLEQTLPVISVWSLSLSLLV